MFKELIELIKMLFKRAKPADINDIELVKMKNFPFSGYRFMMWCGRIIYRADNEANIEYLKQYPSKWAVSVNHERIHLMQARKEGTWWKFYRKYFWQWIKGNPIIHPSLSAYYTIDYEMEAYANETNLEYTNNYDGSNLSKYRLKKRKKTYHAHAENWKNWLVNEFNKSINI